MLSKEIFGYYANIIWFLTPSGGLGRVYFIWKLTLNKKYPVNPVNPACLVKCEAYLTGV
jgi:hypothetical protein